MQIVNLPIDQIGPHPLRPRQALGQAGLFRLADLIRQHNFFSPIIVNETPAGYQLVAGERRLRAAKLAGLTEVPCRVFKSLSAAQVLLLTLADALGHEPLSLFDLAASLKQLLGKFRLSKDEVLAKTGLSQSELDQILKTLDLPDAVKKSYLSGQLTNKQLLQMTEFKDPLEALERISALRAGGVGDQA